MNISNDTPLGELQLYRNSFGHLELTDAGGNLFTGVVPVRAFPIAAPDEGISLVSREGHELVWLDNLDELAADTRRLVEEELAAREFAPVILQLKAVSTFATPSTWMVSTDRGDTEFVLRGEEDIRRISPGRLHITDSHGIQYQIPDQQRLDMHSRKLLDRFL